MKTNKLPSSAKKGSEEENSFRGVVYVGVAILEWPVINLLMKHSPFDKSWKKEIF